MPTQHFTIHTSGRRQIADITDQVAGAVRASGLAGGLICVSVPHCTCALYVNENEKGLVADTLELIERIAGAAAWRHDRIDDNADAHLAATLIGSSVTLPLSAGRVELGTWQRIMLVELDGPRTRRVTVTLIPG